MKKPDVAKRLLPLLDIMMLLLSFFIVLPQGIVTNERNQIQNLEKAGQDLQQRLDYLKWHYGNREEMAGNIYKTMELVLVNDTLHFDTEKLNEEEWEKKIGLKVELEGVSFMFIRISDTPGGRFTQIGTVEKLKNICRKLKLLFIVETRTP